MHYSGNHPHQLWTACIPCGPWRDWRTPSTSRVERLEPSFLHNEEPPRSRFSKMTDISELLDARNRHISRSLSLALGAPLHITRGEMQYLFAADGTRYLDLVNNVSHVGHCNPTVVEAGQLQM